MDRWPGNRRWAPAAVAVAVVVLVGSVALVLSGDDDQPGRVATLPAPSVQASPAPEASSDVGAQAPTQAPRPAASPRPTTPRPQATAPAPAPKPTRTAAPAPAPTSTTAARSAFAFDAAYGTDEPYEVVVQYGDSSSCPHSRVTHAVRESADRVVVTLEADAMDPARACTADYRQMLVPVRLQSPLGDRVLVDGSRDEQVAVDRSCNRPFENPPPPKDCTP